MPQKTMTRNEYNNFLGEQADIAWKNVFAITGGIGKKITEEQEARVKEIWVSFHSAVDAVKILPFDLSEFNLPENIVKVINANFGTEREGVKNRLLDGHCDLDDVHGLAYQLNMENGILNGFNGFYRNDKLMLLLDYCEGDVNLTLFTDKTAYKDKLKRKFKWYEENCC